MEKEKRKLNIGLLIFRIISLIIATICLIIIYNWYIENNNNKALLNIALSNVQVDKIVVDSINYTILDVNFDSLKNDNSDIIGWIYLENSNINYPIVKTNDNSFYLDHSFNKSYNSAGWIFADYRCEADFSSKNTTIYGHNRRDLSMFATLKNTLNEDWYTNNKYLTIATPEGNRIYQIFAIYSVKAELYYSTPNFASDEEYINFLNTMKQRSVYDFGVTLESSDSIVTLSTCANNNTYRVVLQAKLLSIIPNE